MDNNIFSWLNGGPSTQPTALPTDRPRQPTMQPTMQPTVRPTMWPTDNAVRPPINTREEDCAEEKNDMPETVQAQRSEESSLGLTRRTMM